MYLKGFEFNAGDTSPTLLHVEQAYLLGLTEDKSKTCHSFETFKIFSWF